MSDIWTVMRKELREYVALRGSARGGLIGLLIFAAFVGVVVPLEVGIGWVDSPISLLSAFWLPLILALSVVGDAVAGERERHTLETLLASRLSDRAILLGKVAAATTYGWALTLVATGLGLLAVNLVSAVGGGRLALFSPFSGLAMLALSLLGASLTTGAGVLVSLRAATVREAQQRLSIGMMAVFLLLLAGLQTLPPSLVLGMFQPLTASGDARFVIEVIVALFAVDAALLLLTLRRFSRTRLFLD